ncbi:hypothetical protein FGG78_28530 [Thioclava sp. BHET1]|nr:hypothetical protein FGG78_28530 [Thioclava sp. BHET1]
MDIALFFDQLSGRADWDVVDGQIVGGSDLETAVIVSLFTDQVLPEDGVATDGSSDPRGWWADTYRGQPIGSLLWTLERVVKSNAQALLEQAKQICLDALAWLIEDGVAASVQVQTQWLEADALGIAITITEPAGRTVVFRYAWAWQGV